MRNYIFSLVPVFLLSIFPFAPCTAGGQPKAPDSEKRSSIHQVDGFAYLSEDKTVSQIRSEAFALAKRQALEAAQTYIQSKTKVESAKLTYDLIWSEAEGSVRLLDQKDFGIEKNTRYHVWIKAEVFYDLAPKHTDDTSKPPASGHLTAFIPGSGPLTVNVWTDKKTYIQGEEVIIYLQGNRDFFAVVVDVMANGDIIQLLPNTHRTENFFRGGTRYRIPGNKDHFSLAVSEPYGKDTVVVYASESSIDSLPTHAIGGGLGAFRGTQTDLSEKARGIRIETTGPAQAGQGVEFYEGQWSFSTVAH